MKRMIAWICLERFNFTKLQLPFFVRFLGVIACGTKSDWLSLSSMSLPLSVANCCCRFFLNILPTDSFAFLWWFRLSLHWTCNKNLYIFQALQATRYRTDNWTTISLEIHWHIWKNWQANGYFAKKVHLTILKNHKYEYHLDQHHHFFQRGLKYFFVYIKWQVRHIHLLELLILQG